MISFFFFFFFLARYTRNLELHVRKGVYYLLSQALLHLKNEFESGSRYCFFFLDWLCAGILSAPCYGSLLKALETKKDLLTGEVAVGISGRIFCYHFCLLAVLAAYVARRSGNV